MVKAHSVDLWEYFLTGIFFIGAGLSGYITFKAAEGGLFFWAFTSAILTVLFTICAFLQVAQLTHE